MNTNEEVKKFGVLIFESLPNKDKKNGKILYDEVLKYKKFQEDNLSIEYYDIADKSELLNKLTVLIEEAIKNNYFFILHFEMHGFYGGISTKNGEKILWNELFPLFQKLNTFYRNYLCIYLAVCEGASMIESINPEERAPFRSIVASIKKIKSHDLLIGFEKFYDHFFFSFDVSESLIHFNSAVENKSSELTMINCDYCFDMICNFKRKDALKPQTFRLIEESLSLRIPLFKYLSKSEQERFVNKELDDLEQKCKANRDYFLMNDLRTGIHDSKL